MKIKEKTVEMKNKVAEWYKNHKDDILFYGGMVAGVGATVFGTYALDKLLYAKECSLSTYGYIDDKEQQAHLNVYRVNRFEKEEKNPILAAKYPIYPDGPNRFGNVIAGWVKANQQSVEDSEKTE